MSIEMNIQRVLHKAKSGARAFAPVFLVILSTGMLLAFVSRRMETKEESGNTVTTSLNGLGGQRQEKRHIFELESAIGFDPRRTLYTRPYEPQITALLVEELNSLSRERQRVALGLLAEFVKQLEVPASDIYDTVIPQIEEIQRTLGTSTSTDSIEFVRLAKRVSWQVRIKELTRTSERLEFLRGYLEDRADGYYYPFQAMDYLVQIGTNEAKGILEEKYAESRSRSMSEKLLERLRISIEEIDLLERLTNLPPQSRVAELENELIQAKARQSTFRQEFRVWLIRTVARISNPASRDLLRRIWEDDTYDIFLRYEAQEALIQAGAIQLGERTITFPLQ